MLPIADSKHLQKELEKYCQYSPKGGKISNISSYLITHDPQGHIASRCVAASEAGPSTFALASWFENPRVVGSSTNHATRPWHLEALGDKWFVGCCVWYFLDGRYLVRNELLNFLMKHRPLNFHGQLCDHQRVFSSHGPHRHPYRIPRISRFVHLPHPGPVDETSHQTVKPRESRGDGSEGVMVFWKLRASRIAIPSIHPSLKYRANIFYRQIMCVCVYEIIWAENHVCVGIWMSVIVASRWTFTLSF